MQAIPQSKNNVEAAFAEVSNQYKRRADLVPNLVGVVKGYAKHEQETLTAVIEARSKATQITVDPTNLTPEKLKQFQSAQSGMSQALGRLMVVSEQYPNLKADSQFRDLQAQLEGTENRITVARQRYIQAVQEFNNIVTVPPTSWTNSVMYHFEKMPQWEVAEDEKGKVEKPPQVSF
jgi:LemA protein